MCVKPSSVLECTKSLSVVGAPWQLRIARSCFASIQMSAGPSHYTVPRTQSRPNSRFTNLDKAGTKLPVHLIFNQGQEQPDNVDPLRLDWSPAVWDASSYGSGKETTKGYGLPVVKVYQEPESPAIARDRRGIRDVGLISVEPSEVIMCEKMILIRTWDLNKHS